MRKFSLGVFLGLTSGVILSLLQNKNGQRLGSPIKENFDSATHDVKKIHKSIDNAKDTQKKLIAALPVAQKSINDINDSVKKYHTHIISNITNIQTDTNKIKKIIKNTKPDFKNS